MLPFWAGAFISGGVAVLYAKLFFLAESGTPQIETQKKLEYVANISEEK